MFTVGEKLGVAVLVSLPFVVGRWRCGIGQEAQSTKFDKLIRTGHTAGSVGPRT